MLELTTEEENLLNYVGANYAHVVVLINSTNVMELGQIETIPGVDSCLIVGPQTVAWLWKPYIPARS